MSVQISNIRQMRPKTRTLTVQEGANSGNHSPHSPPSRLQPAKTDLKNIIELTEEQETYPNPTENPKEEQHQPVPSQSKVAAFKNYFLCISNLWRYLCRSPTRWELDVNDSDFTTAISRLKSKKSYYASVLPAQKQKKKILVLDMDQTLIHTTFTKPPAYDYESEVIFNGRTTKIYTVKRFGLESFLFQMSKLFQIVIFTASQKLYADKILDMIDPKKRIAHRLYRQHCIVINKTYYLKNLKILGRELKDTIIVDDNSIAGLLHPDNFYRIEQFDGNQKDRQLCRLSAFLKYVHPKSDFLPIREYRKKFQEMEINLEEAVIGAPIVHGKEGRSLKDRKKQYKHKKTNSEVEALVIKEEPSEEAETTAGELIKNKM